MQTRFQPFARALAQATKVRKTGPNDAFLEAVPQARSTGPNETARNVFFGGSNADVSSLETEAKELN